MAEENFNQSPTTPQTSYPLVAFEHYMLADDRASHSMVVQMRFWFEGCFIKDHFIAALRQVLRRNPIFQMTVKGRPNQRTKNIRWVQSSELIMPYLDWGNLGEPLKHQDQPFHQDLTQEIGLRIWIRDNSFGDPAPSEVKTLLLVQFHHSVCDGVGMLQFVEDLMIHYGIAAGFPSPSPRPLDHQAFSKRGDFALTRREWKLRRWRDVRRALKFFRSLAQPLATPRLQKGTTTKIADVFASERRVLSSESLHNIRQVARTENATVNDVLLHGLFRTLSSWNYRSGRIMNKIRIGIATSLRTAAEEALSAVNVVSMVFLDKSHHEVASNQLLSSIVKETKDIKQHRMGVTLPRVVRLLGRLPFAVPAFMSIPFCSATAILTNLGATLSNSPLLDTDGKLKVGNITLDGYELMPPVRPKTVASFATNYYGDQLSITLRYDSTALTRDSAEDLLGQYCLRLEEMGAST